jgi:hypothetical protein
MAEQPSAAIGTAIRAGTVLALANQAGFSSCEIRPIEKPALRFYRLRNSAYISFNVRPARRVQLTAIESNKSDKSRTDNDETEDDRACDDEWVFHTEAKYALSSAGCKACAFYLSVLSLSHPPATWIGIRLFAGRTHAAIDAMGAAIVAGRATCAR